MRKCEAVAVGATTADSLTAHLPREILFGASGEGRVARNFELLGAAVGDDDYTAAHTYARCQAAVPLLDAISGLEDPLGLRLLRACAGHARLVHGMRCTPPKAQLSALEEFDALAQGCFLTAEQVRQTQRGLAQAGLGLRSAVRDAPAAYLASLGGSISACADLDPSFEVAAVPHQPSAEHALQLLNAQMAEDERVPMSAALGSRQKQLTAKADAAAWNRQLAGALPWARAVLISEAEAGARAFLAAVPHLLRRIDPAVFVAELRHRLLVPEAAEDVWCPECDGIMDCHSLHAGVCIAGGERTQRHNAVRNLLCSWADRAGLQPERERPGLLLPQRPGEVGLERRRPADVYLPSFQGSPTALDVAVTACQRMETLTEAGRHAGVAAAAYARTKESHLDTARVCAAQGVQFQPMVLEGTGTWEPGASRVLWNIARAAASSAGALRGCTQPSGQGGAPPSCSSGH